MTSCDRSTARWLTPQNDSPGGIISPFWDAAMTTSTPHARASRVSVAKAAMWLTLTAFLALIVLYFVGMDQGATSVFGNNTYVHEFVHDARHLLGFPCH